ncbi:hypothetical protein BKA62DRAFT_656058 [Auriculariales sp. MPI-PUGE-AT-0066]|nr:hypothetical protein BKA62DRAFT_656058 [Auriculariales sp. MPI-PUGE-AT-0066]
MHRPGDGQLLAQLIKHDKDYATALATLATASVASRDSLSAYASAAPSQVSAAISVLVGALVGADDALHGFREAFEEWRQHLGNLKELQDEVQVVLRDRQILINRVIKVTKGPRSTAGGPSGSSSSLSSHDAKVAQAQSELRACESFLADKERETELAWVRAMRDGLRARAVALVQLGLALADRARHALTQLDSTTSAHAMPHLDATSFNHHSLSRSSSFDSPVPRNLSLPPSSNAMPNGHARLSLPPSSIFSHQFDPQSRLSWVSAHDLDRPLPPPPAPASDNSSLTPSQSASQIDGLPGSNLSRQSTLSQRGAGDVSGLPSQTIHTPVPMLYQHPGKPRTSMIMEEPEQMDIESAPEGGGSSDDDEPVDPKAIRVVENNAAKRASAVSLHQQFPTSKSNLPVALPKASTSRKTSRSTLSRRQAPQLAHHHQQQSSVSLGGSPIRHNFPSFPAPPPLGRVETSSSHGSGKRVRSSSFSSSFFGGIANMFGSKKRTDSESANLSPPQDRGAWASRTDARLRQNGASTAQNADSSDDDRRQGRSTVTVVRNGSGRSRKSSLKSLTRGKDDTSKVYDMGNRAKGGGFAFSRAPARAQTTEIRSSSDVGPSTANGTYTGTAKRSPSAAAATRRPLDARGASLMELVESAATATGSTRSAINGRRQSVQVVSASSPPGSAASTMPRRDKRNSAPSLPSAAAWSSLPGEAAEVERGSHRPVTREAEKAMGPLRSALRNRSPSPALSGSVENEPASRTYTGYQSSPLKESAVLPTMTPTNGIVTPAAEVGSGSAPTAAVVLVDRPSPPRHTSSGAASSIPLDWRPPSPLEKSQPSSSKLDIPARPISPADSDTASISSYETGHETLLGDPPSHLPEAGLALTSADAMGRPLPPSKPLPPDVARLTTHATHAGASSQSTISLHEFTPPGSMVAVSGSPVVAQVNTVSTASTDTTATRRKSVRMVLPPDFVGTPTTTPTAEFAPVEVGRPAGAAPRMDNQYQYPPPPQNYASAPNTQPGHGGWSTRNGTTERDMWADSSDEDMESDYARARRALARADRQAGDTVSGSGGSSQGKTRTRRP